MASVGFGILGSFFGPIGGLIGSAIGSYVDSVLFAPATTPNIKNLKVTVSTYGNPLPLLYGPQNRIAGNIFWSSGLKKKKYVTGKQKWISALMNPVGLVSPLLGDVLNPMSLLTSIMTQSNYTYSSDLAISLADTQFRGPIEDVVMIWANGTIIYDKANPPTDTRWSALRVYKGTFDQMQDPTIELALGARTPAYRGTAYLVLADFQLADYGNTLPNFQFLVEADKKITVASTVAKIAQQAGIDPDTVSTSSVVGEVLGFSITDTSPTANDALAPLALAYMFDVAEVGGGLRFWRRGAAAKGKLAFADLGSYEGDDRPEAVSFARGPEIALPQQATFSYIDASMSWQVNSQLSQRVGGNSQSNMSAQANLVLSADTAKSVADRMLWEAWTARATATTNTSDRLIDLQPGDSYLVDTGTGFEAYRVRSKTRGANGVAALELTLDRPEIYESDAAGAEGNPITQTEGNPPDSIFYPLDIPMLRDADDDTGFYMVVGADTEDDWRGASILRSTDNGDTYTLLTQLGGLTTTGMASGLGDGPTSVIDRATVMIVAMTDPSAELDTVTEEQLLEGYNAAWIGPDSGEGGEIIQFATPTLIAPGVFELTDLLRGRLGTEYATATHVDGENFVLLQNAVVARVDLTPGDWNKPRLYEAITVLTDPTDPPSQSFTNTGESKRPLSPVSILGSTADDGDLTINWIRRSRFRQPGLGNGPLALGEAYEAYEIDISVASVVVRTLKSSTPTVVYSAGAQATDGVGSGDTIGVAVYQMSDVRGRGRPGLAELTI